MAATFGIKIDDNSVRNWHSTSFHLFAGRLCMSEMMNGDVPIVTQIDDVLTLYVKRTRPGKLLNWLTPHPVHNNINFHGNPGYGQLSSPE